MAENIKEEIEDKIIDFISLGSGGRLVVFKPDNSDKDLIVEKKGEYEGDVISLKIYGREFSGERSFEKEVRQLAGKGGLEPEGNFYLMFVNFNIVKQDVTDNFLVMPSGELERAAAGNDLSKFMMSKKEFVGFLIDECLKK